MTESEKSGGTIRSPADTEIDATAVMVRLVRVLDTWMTSDRSSDYIELRIIGYHTAWKRAIFRKEEFTWDMVWSEHRIARLKEFFLKRYILTDNSPSYDGW